MLQCKCSRQAPEARVAIRTFPLAEAARVISGTVSYTLRGQRQQTDSTSVECFSFPFPEVWSLSIRLSERTTLHHGRKRSSSLDQAEKIFATSRKQHVAEDRLRTSIASDVRPVYCSGSSDQRLLPCCVGKASQVDYECAEHVCLPVDRLPIGNIHSIFDDLHG